MNELTDISQLSFRSNINTYEYGRKTIVLYDDHRWILNVIYEAKKLNLFRDKLPNVIYFDYHDDGMPTHIILGNYGVDNVTDIDARSFWSMVEFDVRSLDDNWVTTGMELGLINNVICVGQVANNNIDIWENNEYIDNKGVRHKGFCIRHFQEEMKRGGVFERISHASGDITTDIQHILDYSERGFLSVVRNPFILDFDLDCFSYNENGEQRAWPEKQFIEYYLNPDVYYFMCSLIDRATIITICREPKCCGGLGESNKILGYLDRYLFDGALGTEPIQ